MDQVKVGEFISTARKEKRMTQKELAEQIGVSDKTISRREMVFRIWHILRHFVIFLESV